MCEDKMYQNATLSLSTRVYIYIICNSDTVEALSLSKRVYAILCRNKNSAVVLSLAIKGWCTVYSGLVQGWLGLWTSSRW